jgi:hypothetical protein
MFAGEGVAPRHSITTKVNNMKEFFEIIEAHWVTSILLASFIYFLVEEIADVFRSKK